LPVGSSAKTTLGLGGERARHGDALLLAARQLGGAVAQAVAQPDGVDQAGHPRLVGLAAGDGQRQLDVLLGRQDRQQVEGLEDEADLVAAQVGELLVVELGELRAVQDDRAGRRPVESGEQVHERRLARARGAHDGGELARGEVDRDPGEGVDGRLPWP
jgi:hypothetical protein